MLNPLVRLLLRFDMSHSEFSEIARRSYVHVAKTDFAIPGRAPTHSHVAVITGLSRKEVVRLSEVPADEAPQTRGPLNRATRVISGWMQDAEFVDSTGQPRILALRGEPGSFDELVTRYSGDISSRAVLDELLRVGAVERVDKQYVRLLNKGYIPRKDEPELVRVLSKHVADHLDTAVHNIAQDEKDARFQRQVTYHEMPLSIIEEFREFSHQRSMDLLVEFDQWLAERKKNISADNDETKGRVGVGVYFFQNDKQED